MKRNYIDLTADSDTETVLDDSIYFKQKTITQKHVGATPLEGILNPAYGYAVVPFPNEIREKFSVIQFLREQREFTTVDENQLFVLGGFQALANPSSYHHPLRRELMEDVYDYMATIFANVFENSAFSDYKYFSMIPDRFGIRRNDQQVGAESWHKDQSLDAERSRNAIVFGGWINLDPIGSDKMQYFNCIPGESVLPNRTEEFYTENMAKGFNALKEDLPALDRRRARIEVPPGHLVIFNELLTHEVAQGKSKKKGEGYNPNLNSYRCYLKWFLSKDKKPYWKPQRLNNFFEKQTQIGMSIHQPDAPFYASAHYSTSQPLLAEISNRVIEPIKTFSMKNYEDRMMAARFMGTPGKGMSKISEETPRTGLVDWNLAFPAYTPEQLRIYEPRLLF